MGMTTASAAYFERVAGEWDTLRAGYFQEDVREAAIAHAYLRPEMVVGDVGSGTGFVAAGLAPLVSKVFVLDGAAAMLDVARRNLAGFDNVVFDRDERARPAAARCQPRRGVRQHVFAPLPRSGGGHGGDGARAEAGRAAGDHRHGRARPRLDAGGDGRRVAGVRPEPGQDVAARRRPGERDRRLHRPVLRGLAEEPGGHGEDRCLRGDRHPPCDRCAGGRAGRLRCGRGGYRIAGQQLLHNECTDRPGHG